MSICPFYHPPTLKAALKEEIKKNFKLMMKAMKKSKRYNYKKQLVEFVMGKEVLLDVSALHRNLRLNKGVHALKGKINFVQMSKFKEVGIVQLEAAEYKTLDFFNGRLLFISDSIAKLLLVNQSLLALTTSGYNPQ